MDVRAWLLVIALAVGLLLLAGGLFGESPSRVPAAPEVTYIEFPKEITADGEPVTGAVGFHDPDGDVAWVRFEVVEALLFEPFAFDPEVQGQSEGEFYFYVQTVVPQTVTLRVVLIDAQGHESEPVEFSFEAKGELLSPEEM
jgi:hypothetical protein